MTFIWYYENENQIEISASDYLNKVSVETHKEIRNYFLLRTKPETRKSEVRKSRNELRNLIRDFQDLRQSNEPIRNKFIIGDQIRLLKKALSGKGRLHLKN